MNVSLRIACREKPQRAAAAWFVPGATAEEWLAELADWQTPLAAARLYVIPASTQDRTPCGVLVLGAAPPSARRSPRALPYGVLARRLYLPVDAELEPSLDDAELERLLAADDALYLWRPHAGPVQLTAARALTVGDLLTAPEPGGNAWNCGVAGVALNARLLSIEPEATLTVENLFEQTRDDIGTQPLDLEKLPPAQSEPSPGAAGALGRALQQKLAQTVYWMMQHVPHSGAAYNWLNKIEDWAGAKLDQLAQSLEASRHRELARLLDLLRSDPDEGLRFALPMGGDEHRGLAPPSGRLGMRNVDFSLDQLRGGRAADFWDLPATFRMQLIARYRELAARELALGRHRRAAYIFATLLGDFNSAAAALCDGGHWREAAVLYEQRLKRPHEAARCLRQGGLWSEAIALYEKLGEHETVGDLYQQLDQREAAEQAWLRAVAACDARSDALGASRLLEQKLGLIDAAWQRLRSAWPRSPQAALCVTEAFQLFGRHARHERAMALVDELIAEPAYPQSEAVLVELVAAQALGYADTSVCEHAADRTRIVAADRLEGARLTADETRRIALAVARLVPADRLLARDAQRWLKQRLQPRAAVKPIGKLGAKLSLEREFQLSRFVDWNAAVGTDDALYVAGYRDRDVELVRVSWRGAMDPRWQERAPRSQGLELADSPTGEAWRVEPKFVGRPILLAADPYGEAPTLVHVLGHEPFAPRSFAVSERFPAAMTAGGHRGLTASSVSANYAGRVTVNIVEAATDAELVFNVYLSHDAQLLGLISLYLRELATGESSLHCPLPVLTREQTLCVAVDRDLHFFRQRQTAGVVSLPGRISQIIGSAPHSRARIAVAMQQGGVILWGDHAQAEQTPFASEMVDPRIALTRRGWLVAASKDEIDVYSTGGGELSLHARAAGSGAAPLAALATHAFNQFALVYPGGRVAIYRISER